MRSGVFCGACLCATTLLGPAIAKADCSAIDFAIEIDRLYPGGSSISGDFRCTLPDSTSGARLIVGEIADGELVNALVGGRLALGSGEPSAGAASAPYLGVGLAPGVTGVLGGFEYVLEGADNAVRVDVGRRGVGSIDDYSGTSSGFLTITDLGASPGSGRVSGDMLVIGSDGGTGNVEAVQSTVTVESGSGPSAIIGLNGGSGTVSLLLSGALLVRDYDTDPTGPGAMLAVGVNTDGVSGGVGGLYTGGDYGRVRVEADAAPATLLIGSGRRAVGRVSAGSEYAGIGVVSDSAARMIVGSGEGAQGVATASWYGGFGIHGGESAVLDIGVNGGNGVVDIGGGGGVSMTGPDARVNVGAAFADEGRAVGGEGRLSVVGNSYAYGYKPSSLRVTGDVVVGAPESMGGGEASGLLSVAESGRLQANRVLVGRGGRLDGRGERLRADGSFSVEYGSDGTNFDGGFIIGDVVLDGGVIAPGGALGLFSIDGDFTPLGGFLDIDVAGNGVGWSDLIRVSGDFLGAGAFGVRMNFIDGFLPQVGDSFSFFEVAGDATRLESLFAASLITVENAGLPPGSQVSLAYASGRLSAVLGAVGVVLPPDPTDPDVPPQPPVAPVPLPGALELLLGGFAVVVAVKSLANSGSTRWRVS